jgi:hypothetical protein
MSSIPLLVVGAGLLALASCHAIGPTTVARDRFDYNGEVSRSWKEQTLLNIVKARYADMPVFLDVAQIVSGYTLESSIALGAGTTRGSAPSDTYSLGASGKWTDRPTITYSPLTGAQFNRSMLTPIPPAAVLFTMQAGWPVDQVFRITVRSVNGISSTGPDNARYERLVTLLRTLQLAQVVGMRVQGEKVEQQTAFMFFRARALTAEQQAMVEEVRQILSLRPGTSEFRVVFGAVPANDGEIALLTRSMLQMLIDLGEYAEVPEEDVRAGRTGAGALRDASANGKLLRIQFSSERPRDALVQVHYRGGWYWIDDRDMASKRTFALVMIFSTLLETGARESMPLVTIPAG